MGKSIKKLGLPFPVCVKDLRTTFSTRCKELGVPDEVLAKWLGHTTTHTTQKHYIKVLPDYEKIQAEKLKNFSIDKTAL